MKPAEKRLRARYAELMRAVESSSAMRVFAHDLRVMLDPRPLPARIDDAVAQHLGALQHLSTSAQSAALQSRLDLRIRETSLERAPSLPVLRERLIALYDELYETSGVELSPAHGELLQATSSSL